MQSHNAILLWDAIIRNKDDSLVQRRDMRAEYPLTDVQKELRSASSSTQHSSVPPHCVTQPRTAWQLTACGCCGVVVSRGLTLNVTVGWDLMPIVGVLRQGGGSQHNRYQVTLPASYL